MIRIGTAGWSIPRDLAGNFPAEGTSLERYAARLTAAEINSSFHRPHNRSLYERWAAAVPPRFRFSVKIPKTITHQHKLADCDEILDAFAAEASGLGDKWAVALVQLPPSFAFDADLAGSFFASVRTRTPAAIACEPRHPSWFEPGADALLADLKVARVAADPARVPAAAAPGGWRGLTYFRLHGSPIMYRSSYDSEALAGYAAALADAAGERWCIFDNTASSAATANALDLLALTSAEQ